MRLKKLKASLERLLILSCDDFEQEMASIDFDFIAKIEKNTDVVAYDEFGIRSYGKSAMSIDDGVATVKVSGLLVPETGVDITSWGVTGYDVIRHYLDFANNANDVNSITLDFDSGGGYISGVHQTAQAIKDSTKPVTSFISSGAYSAAYWLAVSADEIVAGQYSGVGSIGAYIKHQEHSEMLKNEGITTNIFKTGYWKAAFSAEKPLTDKEKTRLQESVNESANEFYNHVADNRNLTVKAIKKLEADSFGAEKALELGLIDRIESSTKSTVTKTKGASEMTQEEHERLLAEAVAKAKTEALAQAETKATRALEIQKIKADDAVLLVLATDDFASVSIKAMTKLAEALPKSFVDAMDDEGGAGLAPSPQNFAEKTAEEIKAEQVAKANAEMAELMKDGGVL